MYDEGTLSASYAFDQHIGRTNVLEFYKDDCHSKPYAAIKDYFAAKKATGSNLSTFDYKPESLMRALVRDFSSPGHTVVDFCMRHGITAVAAKLECRKFIGIELDPKSYSRAVSRYNEQFPTTSMLSPPKSPTPSDSDTDIADTADTDTADTDAEIESQTTVMDDRTRFPVPSARHEQQVAGQETTACRTERCVPRESSRSWYAETLH